MSIILLLAATAPDALAQYRTLTQVAIARCRQARDAREIQVCGRRESDRYRVPLVSATPGDPKLLGVPAERATLIRSFTLPCGRGAIIADCGSGVGVAATASFGVSGSGTRVRPLAD